LRARRERPCDRRVAECSQQFPPSDGDCHTPSRARCVKGRIPRHERPVFTLGGQDAGRFHRYSRRQLLANTAIAATRVAVRGRGSAFTQTQNNCRPFFGP
jgi:hypothetical protein